MVGVAHRRTMNRRFLALAGSALLVGAMLPAARDGQGARSGVHQGWSLHRPAGRRAGRRLQGRQGRTQGHEAGQGQEDRPDLGQGHQVRRPPARQAERRARRRRRRQEALQLRLQLQRLRRPPDGEAGEQAGRRQGRRGGQPGRDAVRRHVVHAGLPRPDRRGRHLGPARRPGRRRRGRHHRHHRLRHLARVAELRRPREGRPAQQRARARKQVYQQIPGWHGKCMPGEGFNASLCNQKLIGAQYFNAGQGGNAGIDAEPPVGVQLRRATTTATARTPRRPPAATSTSPTTGAAPLFGTDQRHGPAGPHRGVQGPLVDRGRRRPPSGSTPDIVAAIDQAVADGVDVINYSISGTPTNFADPVEIAFLFAADAGVFVAASAGNSGPAIGDRRPPEPVDHHGRGGHPQPRRPGLGDPGQRRDLQRRVRGDAGRSRAAHRRDGRRRSPAPIRPRSRCASRPATTAATPSSTRPRSPARSWSAIAASTPGSTRASRSRRPAASGMILVNTDRRTRSTPTSTSSRRSTSRTRTARPSRPTRRRPARPRRSTRRRSSSTRRRRSPRRSRRAARSRAGGGDLLKPDVIAPGQDILAAVAPPGNARPRLQPPQRHVDVEPARRRPRGAAQGPPPGLVADGDQVGADDHRHRRPRRAEHQPARDLPPGRGPRDRRTRRPTRASSTTPASSTGWPSCAARPPRSTRRPATRSRAPASARPERLQRRVDRDRRPRGHPDGHPHGHQRRRRAATYTARPHRAWPASPPSSARVAHARSGRERRRSTVTFTRDTAALNAYVGGQLTLVRRRRTTSACPIVIRPVALAAPAEVHADGGAISYDVKFGYAGAVHGHARAASCRRRLTAGTVADDPTDSTSLADLAGNAGHQSTTSSFPAGTTYARFSLFDADVNAGARPRPVRVQRRRAHARWRSAAAARRPRRSTSSTRPPPRTRSVVHGFGGRGRIVAASRCFNWVLGSADAGNMTVDGSGDGRDRRDRHDRPDFTGLAAGTKYLGSVAYGGAAEHAEPDDRAGRPLAISRRRLRRRPTRTRGPRHPPGASSRLVVVRRSLAGGGFSHQRTSLLLVLAR